MPSYTRSRRPASARGQLPRARRPTYDCPALRDVDAIAALIFTYAERIDAGDLDGMAALFAHATYRSHVREYTGAEELARMMKQRIILYDGTPRTKHVTTNVIVDVVGETATARSYFTVLQETPDLPLQPIVAGRYHDRFARTDGVWQFTDRLVLVDLAGDLSRHLR
jgi:3-phenylpropionate/cinnamic acid dioxygenase small subunit